MKKTWITGCLLAGMLFLSGCLGKDFVDEGQNLKENFTESVEQTEITTQSEEDTLEAQIAVATRGCQVVKEGETMSLNGVDITVNDVTVTRKKGDWYDGEWYELNEKGELPEDMAYVVVNVTIERVTENKSFWLNSIWLANFEEDMRIGPRELYGTSLFKEDNGDPDKYENVVKQGETLTTDLIYYIKKAEEGNNAHFLLQYNPTGVSLVHITPEEYCMCYLESLENVWDKVDAE